MKLAELWDVSTKFLWTEDYVEGVLNLLTKHKVSSIIDCAGGQGHLVIPLRNKGYDITYSDGSEQMYDHFKKKARKLDISIPSMCLPWGQLAKKVSNTFEAVFCSGNSLVYVDSWDENSVPEEAHEHIRTALRNFYSLLEVGGFLYVDIINEREYNLNKYPLVEHFKPMNIDGSNVSLTWKLFHDYKKRLRKCFSTLTIDGVKHEHTYFSYLLRHEELVKLLKKAGFTNVQETHIHGENNYTSFLAFK